VTGPEDVRTLPSPGARWWSTAEPRDEDVSVEPETPRIRAPVAAAAMR
jgi:hypothetical protein